MDKFISFFFLLTLSLLWSCEVDNAVDAVGTLETTAELYDTVSVTLKNTNEYTHDFQICGDEEGATIITPPQHAETSAIIRDEFRNWCTVYKYKPAKGFVGRDYVEIETCTGGVGVSCSEKDTVRIELTVLEGGEQGSASFVASHYYEDAKQLYFREVINDSSHANYDDPVLNTGKINEVLAIIQAVYNSNSPERDTVFDVHKIHTQYCYSFNSIFLNVNPDLPEIKNLANGIIPTGSEELDKILIQYHFDSVHVSQGSYPKFPFFTIYSSKSYNLIPIENALRRVSSIIAADFDKYCMGGGNSIDLERNKDSAVITFSIGRGDCPAGCTYRKFWEFKVIGDKAQFIKSYERGNPMDADMF